MVVCFYRKILILALVLGQIFKVPQISLFWPKFLNFQKFRKKPKISKKPKIFKKNLQKF